MISKFRIRFGAPGVLAVIALVFALAGGAYAASNALTGKQKKEVEKIAKKFAGEDGKPGATGPAGPAGPAGGAGAQGKQGEQGKEGKEGKEGKAGKEGSPWTAGGVLPSEKTETGAWAWGPVPKEITEAKLALSLPIPLEFGTKLKFHFVTEEEGEEGLSPECPGTVTEPVAKPGNLCMYEAFGTGTFTSLGVFNPSTLEAGSVGPTGVVLTFFGVEEKNQGRGTWAATAS